jgi:hypothetical protein
MSIYLMSRDICGTFLEETKNTIFAECSLISYPIKEIAEISLISTLRFDFLILLNVAYFRFRILLISVLSCSIITRDLQSSKQFHQRICQNDSSWKKMKFYLFWKSNSRKLVQIWKLNIFSSLKLLIVHITFWNIQKFPFLNNETLSNKSIINSGKLSRKIFRFNQSTSLRSLYFLFHFPFCFLI